MVFHMYIRKVDILYRYENEGALMGNDKYTSLEDICYMVRPLPDRNSTSSIPYICYKHIRHPNRHESRNDIHYMSYKPLRILESYNDKKTFHGIVYTGKGRFVGEKVP